jgi:hypothetical protein
MNESYFWVMRAIEGSKTEWHFEACQVLINLFSRQYGDPFTSAPGWEKAAEKLQQALDDMHQ